MSRRKLADQLVHAGGMGDLHYNPTNAGEVFGCGRDGTLRLYGVDGAIIDPLWEESSLNDRDQHKGTIRCLAAVKGSSDDSTLLASGGDDHIVHLYHVDGQRIVHHDRLPRFSVGVTALSFHSNGGTLAIGTEDGSSVRLTPLIDLESHTDMKMPGGMGASIKSLSYDQTSAAYLAISDVTGCVTIAQPDGKKQIVKQFFGLLSKTNTADLNVLHKLSWSPKPSLYLAVAGTKDVILIERNTWRVLNIVKDAHDGAIISVVAFSPNGRYLATASSSSDEHQVHVYDVSSVTLAKKCVDSDYVLTDTDPMGIQSFDSSITSIQWMTQQSSLLVLCADGNMKKWSDPLGGGAEDSFSDVTTPASLITSIELATTNPSSSSSLSSNSNSPTPVSKPSLSSALDDDDDMDFEAFAEAEARALKERELLQSAKKSKNAPIESPNAVATHTLAPITSTEEDDEKKVAPSSSLNAESETKRRRLRKDGETTISMASVDDDTELVDDGDDDMDNFIEDDTGGAYFDDSEDFEAAERAKLYGNGLTSLPLQEPFQSGSTPEGPSVKRRFLAYNTVGDIVTRDEDPHYSQVEIMFTDTTKYKPVKMRDYYRFHLASLGEHSAIFASRAKQKTEGTKGAKEEERASTIFVRYFDSWAGMNSDWTYHLPLGEEAQAVAVGKTFAACATNKQYLRIFTLSGMQRSVLSLPGPIVTLAGSTTLLAVVFHAGPTFHEFANLQCWLLDMETHRKLYDGVLPITKKSKLIWLDFSDSCLPVAMDSTGVLRGLTKEWDWEWAVLLDTNTIQKARGDFHWPIGLVENKLMCALCKNGLKYPNAATRPVLTAVNLSMPFLDKGSVVGAREERFALDEIVLRDQWEQLTTKGRTQKFLQLDKMLLELFALAVKSDRLIRALDLFRFFRIRKSMEIALEIAAKANKNVLVTRLNLMMEARSAVAAQLAAAASASSSSPADALQAILTEENEEMKKRQSSSASSTTVMLPKAKTVPSSSDDGEAEFGSSAASSAPRGKGRLQKKGGDDMEEENRPAASNNAANKKRAASSAFSNRM